MASASAIMATIKTKIAAAAALTANASEPMR
jgi:hypothetical protein